MTGSSLRTKLVVLIAGIFLPLSGVVIWSGYREYRLLQADANRRSLTIGDAAASAVQQFFVGARRVMEGLAATQAEELLDPESCPALLNGMNDVLPDLVNFLAADVAGNTICDSGGGGSRLIPSVAERSWFRETARTLEFHFASPQIGLLSQRWVMALGVPILDEDGELLGVLGGSVDLTTIPELVIPELQDGALVTLANENRVVLARSMEAENWIGRALPEPVNPEVEVSPGRTLAMGQDFTGVERIWARVDVEELGWFVYVGLPRDQVAGPVRARMTVFFGVSGVVALVALLFTISIYRETTGSISGLVEGVDAASDSGRVLVPPGALSEVEELATRFNQTLDARSRAEASAREAEDSYRSIFENAVIGISLGTEDGRILDANPAFLEMMGYDSVEELRKLDVGDLYQRPEDRPGILEGVRETGVLRDAELQWVRKDGRPITLRSNGRLLKTSSGGALIQAVHQDVTETRRIQERLAQSQKMEAVGQLAGGVAHDFNNLLTVIEGNADLLLATLPPGSDDHVCVQEIADAAERAASVTRQLLTFSRRDQRSLQSVDVGEATAGLRSMLQRLLGAEIRLEVEVAQELPRVATDSGQLEQIVLNLVLNARDAVAPGGRIHLSLTGRDRGPDGASGAWCVLEVRDDGVGMDEATQARIFEPFFTTKSKDRGTGLGLATVFGIVDQLGGEVRVESALGDGSTFRVWLPGLVGAGSPVEGAELDDEALQAPHGETVLLAEDEAALRRIMVLTLEGAGYRVHPAADARAALELARTLEEPIHILVSDIIMPNGRGTELAERVREIHPEVEVLLITGYAEDERLDALLRRDPRRVLYKPFLPRTLLARIRELLGRKQGA